MKIDRKCAAEILRDLRSRMNTRVSGRLAWSQTQTEAALCAALANEVEKRRRKFVLEDELERNIGDVALWLRETDVRSGLLICGSIGNGKTTLVLALQTLMNAYPDDFHGRGLRMVKARDVVRLYGRSEGLYRGLFDEPFLAIDDYGLEQQDVLHYGNHAQPLEDVLYHRYDDMLPTILTTNLTLEQLKERVNARLYDRFREQYVVVAYQRRSYREERI